MSLWRWITVLGSVFGIAAVWVIWTWLEPAGTGHLLLSTLPLLIGVAASLVRMDVQYRILLLWGAAALSGVIAVVTIMSGAGIVLLAAMALYLLAGWGMNESASRPASEERSDLDRDRVTRL